MSKIIRKISKNIKKLPSGLKKFIRSNSLVFIFILILLTKLIVFNTAVNLWPAKDAVMPFAIYSLLIAWLIFTPAFFLKKKKVIYLLVADFVFSLILLADVFSIRFFDTLPVISLLSSSSSLLANQLISTIKLFRVEDFIFFVDFMMLAALMIVHKFKIIKVKAKGTKHGSLILPIIFTFLPILFLSFAFRFEWNHKLSIYFNSISENKLIAKNYGVIPAHLVDISRNFTERFNKISPELKQKTVETIEKNKTTLSTNSFTGIAKDKRIIMIQVESLNDFVIGQKVDGQEITPSLNKLANSSNYFANDYFTVGAGGTSDADFSANTSMFPLLDASAFIKYGKDNFTSMAKELNKNGYTTTAYHANSRGYWNRDTALKSLGYQKFYAEDSYKKGETINMGLSDKDFLAQSFELLKNKPTTSFNYLITLSSHYSFDIPVKDQTLKLTEKKYPEITENYLQAIHYTDSAIGEFIDNLKINNMYDDSLIVVYGDHTAKYDAFSTDNKKIDPNSTSGKRVPLFIKIPNQTNPVKYTNPSSHLDIMPTILNLVGVKTSVPMFGKDLFSNAKTFFFTYPFENNFNNVISDSFHYQGTDSGENCYQIVDKKRVRTVLGACFDILGKRDELQNATANLIEHNLFNDLTN